MITMNPAEREQTLIEAYTLFTQSKFTKAALVVKEVLDQDKQDPIALHLLGQISHRQGNYDIARDLYRESLRLDPSQANVWSHLGSVLNDLRDAEGAEKALNKALEMNPKLARAYKHLADIYLNQGEKEKGIAFLEKALEANPDYLGTYLTYAMAVKPPVDHPVVLQIKERLEKEGDQAGSILHYALTYVYENAGDTEAFFKHLHLANDISRDPDSDWREKLVGKVDNIRKYMMPEFLSVKVSEDKKRLTPIFIVGLPRSGTSLTDQIFATHSQCFGGDELQYFEKYMAGLALTISGVDGIPGYASLTMENLEYIASQYQQRVQQLAPGIQFISDKMPWNFRNIGMIAKILPWAKIIHIHRDPLDCGFSCYRNPLSKNIEFTCGMEDYAFYRARYEEIMDHWRQVAPDNFIDLSYEQLVVNPETEIKRVLEYCGLPWEEGLLDFHQTKRQVRTISKDQVNQPLNQKSIGTAAKYKKQLAPMVKALEDYGLVSK